jgi:hypothetical protein
MADLFVSTDRVVECIQTTGVIIKARSQHPNLDTTRRAHPLKYHMAGQGIQTARPLPLIQTHIHMRTQQHHTHNHRTHVRKHTGTARTDQARRSTATWKCVHPKLTARASRRFKNGNRSAPKPNDRMPTNLSTRSGVSGATTSRCWLHWQTLKEQARRRDEHM